MSNQEHQQHLIALNRFVEVANELKDQGTGVGVIAAAMLSATSVYNTYVHAGNTGFLQPAGIDKVTDEFRRHLQLVQDQKRKDLEAQGHNTYAPSPRTDSDA